LWAILFALHYPTVCFQSSTNLTKTFFQHLSLDTDSNAHTITATIQNNEFPTHLVGRYTCSEMINDKKHETTVHVFIQGTYLLIKTSIRKFS
jgi:hypothetical protein